MPRAAAAAAAPEAAEAAPSRSAALDAHLSEEELAACDLYGAGEDELLALDEEEEEEWAKYDQEVERLRDLAALVGSSGTDAYREAAAAAAAAAESGRASRSPACSSTAWPPASSPSPWGGGLGEEAVAGSLGTRPGLMLPQHYWVRLKGGMGGVIVSSSLGPKTVVLLGHSSHGDMRSVLPQALQAQGVRIVRGWMETSGEGFAVDAYEVCEAATGDALSEKDAARLEGALAQVVRTATLREVLHEIDGQVPRLDAFLGLPVDGSRPPPLQDVCAAFTGAGFVVTEACDFGRALILRGMLEDGACPEAVHGECRRRLAQLAARLDDGWECLLTTAPSGLLLVVVPARELAGALVPEYDQRIGFLAGIFLSTIYAQAASPSALTVIPPVGALLMGIGFASEVARQAVASAYNTRLGLPVFLPCPALGTFGAASRPLSTVAHATAAFDMAAAASGTALLLSLALIAIGSVVPVTPYSCAWVNPSTLPFLLQGMVRASEAESHWDVCLQPPDVLGFMPANSLLVAGCFGAVAAALNTLPLGKVDGSALAAAAPSPRAQDTLLPWVAYLVVGLLFLDSSAGGLVPVLLEFMVFTFGLRPLLVPDPVFRDNATRPQDLARQGVAMGLLLLAFLLLMPSYMAAT